MTRPNFFELLKGLDFNEKNNQVIEDAIKQWQKEKNQLFSNASDLIEKNKIKEEMSLESEMRSVMLDANARKQEAQAMIQIRKQEIENLAKILCTDKEGPIPIMNVRLKRIAEKSGLRIQDVSNIFKGQGFEVRMKAATLDFNKYFLRDQIDEINKLLNEMNKPEVAKKYPWLTKKVESLYDLLACYNQEPNMNYYNKKTDDLLIVATEGDKFYSIKQNVQEARTLFSKAKNDAFANDVSRMRYDNSRKLMELDDFLSIAKSVPDSMKKDESFADVVIKKIQTKFPDYDLALTIYNQALGLMRDPYEPEKALIHVYCGNCQSPATFQSIGEAMQAKCPVCGEPYYKQCPNCGNMIPSSTRKCSHCHFDLLEYGYFDSYYKSAQQALKNQDIVSAIEYLNKAKIANPKSNQLPQLDNEIKKLQKQYEEPLNELQTYINNKEFIKAQSYVSQLKSKYPKLNLHSQEKDIQQAINNAKQMFNQKGSNQYAAANTCVRILRDVSDYIDAKEYIMKVTPRPISHLSVSLKRQGVQLNWQASPDIGIHYVVIKKVGSAPMNLTDGKQICELSDALEYFDKEVEPGLVYHYAVFVKRLSIVSSPVSQSISYTVEIDQQSLSFFLDRGKCSFQWSLPKNAIGVRILRCQGGTVDKQITSTTKCLIEKAYSSYEDKNVDDGIFYQYRFQVVYQMNGKTIYTEGITQDIVNEDIPAPTLILSGQYNPTSQRISLNIKAGTSKPHKIQIIQINGNFGIQNDVVDISAISKYGKIVAQGESLNSKIEFNAIKNIGYQLGIVTMAGSKAVLGNCISLSTFDKCEINKPMSRIKNSRLNIHLKEPVAKNIKALYYACMVKDTFSSKPPYLTKDNLDEMKKITVENYNRQHCIPIDAVPECELYITVIAELQEGNKIYYSDPSKLYINNRPKQKLIYDIQWKGTFSRKRDGAKLVITGIVDECPTMYLVGCTNGHIPSGYVGGNAIVIKKIENSDTQSISEMIDIPRQIPSKAKLRLFLDNDDQDEFELEVKNEKNLIVP